MAAHLHFNDTSPRHDENSDDSISFKISMRTFRLDGRYNGLFAIEPNFGNNVILKDRLSGRIIPKDKEGNVVVQDNGRYSLYSLETLQSLNAGSQKVEDGSPIRSRKLSGFNVFCSEQRGVPLAESAPKWNQLSENEKGIYNDRAKDLFAAKQGAPPSPRAVSAQPKPAKQRKLAPKPEPREVLLSPSRGPSHSGASVSHSSAIISNSSVLMASPKLQRGLAPKPTNSQKNSFPRTNSEISRH